MEALIDYPQTANMRLILRHKAAEFLLALSDTKLETASTYSKALTISESTKLDLVRSLIEGHPCSPPSLDVLIARSGLPQKRLNRGFKMLYGQTIRSFTAAARLEKARALLIGSNQSIGEISDTCGFENPNNFTRAFKTKYLITPREFRNR